MGQRSKCTQAALLKRFDVQKAEDILHKSLKENRSAFRIMPFLYGGK